MKTGTSSLNPYAASYIPLSRRDAAGENKYYPLMTKDSNSSNETVLFGSYPENTAQNQHQSKASQNYVAHGTPILEDYALKGNTVYGSYGSSSQTSKFMAEKQILDEESDMELSYLQMMFPGISDESISEVYSVNKGDLEDTIEMLNHLELCTDDSSENLPDTLDIGDVAESGSSSENASQKLKKVAGEVVGPSSGSSESAVVT